MFSVWVNGELSVQGTSTQIKAARVLGESEQSEI